MKTRIFLLLAFMSLLTMNATTSKETNKIKGENSYNNAVTFFERNIQFHVFLNGDFDFNTRYNRTRYFNHNGTIYNHIKRDRKGRIKRIGNTNIRYDFRGNVKRIGNITINYKFGRLHSVGNLRVKYDRWNNPIFYGAVNNYNNDYYRNISITLNYNNPFFYKRDFLRNYRMYREDANFIYYKHQRKSRLKKHKKFIKRRKNKRLHKTTPEQKGRSKRNR